MEKINKYLLVMAAVAVFVICIALFAGGINNNVKIENASMLITDNKTNINPEGEITTPSSISLDDKKNILSKYKNTNPKKGGFKIERGAKINVTNIPVPKEIVIEAIANGDKKVTEEDIIAIAKEYNMNVTEIKNGIIDAKT
ncbi:MAG: hypothetical protein GW779_03775 [Candidatus Altiarchaeum hamiconexum]|uniref:Uncharacterized protein n=1 Tax=Candidatus Altarchaeum hamiconexum TaxID=1803513 RepID=A0A8J7YUU8_9ARCH|nr:hypothetical protein [Candidatus Altarchaeum hamiconexum]OIQ05308.1 MAG: hypothetical protein AUK59_04385 [Candidatus Altarchaeum sp. CG2_30_32_3053]PIN68164.1 MAG: hypothetical protein COV98_00200 [Candidatus Altarchaeum sp. CG12_big_fil_rev_8_21_14_0_65_33_22]PIV28505.1 MAG: hypothetical protein COS36_01925 [Candidatus Altarchaeum sp. CG03_land_8_20_14_0_80_32_618]PIZ31100.1 MAG: hypothetical protein COY41_03015 [Candidatus Altarchaeum sp. CG_4_10_14_0_8_um_filter_32_851]